MKDFTKPKPTLVKEDKNTKSFIKEEKEQNNNNIEQQTQTQQKQVQSKIELEQKTHVQKLEEKRRAQITSQINTDGSESDDEKRYKELYERYQNKDSNNNLSIKEMLEMRKLEKKLNVSQNQLSGK